MRPSNDSKTTSEKAFRLLDLTFVSQPAFPHILALNAIKLRYEFTKNRMQ
jgi:hypothetical protein